MAYAPNLSGKHGGGFDPNGGAFVQVPAYQQSYPSQAHHCGGGNYDPNGGAIKPVAVVHSQPVARPQPTFSSQASTTYRTQSYQQFQQPPPQNRDTRPGFITQLCACFR